MSLKDIVKELNEIRVSEDLRDLEDNMLMDCAVRIFNSQSINSQKNASNPLNKPYTIDKPTTNELITQKRRDFLEKSGFEGDISKLTKEEARQIIKEGIERQKKIRNGEEY